MKERDKKRTNANPYQVDKYKLSELDKWVP